MPTLPPTPPTPQSATPPASPLGNFIQLDQKKTDGGAYSDLFQQSGSGNEIRIGPKVQKPILEIITDWLGIALVIFFFVVLGLSADVWLRKQEDNTWAAKYTFLCPYISMGVLDSGKEDNECRTTTKIKNDFDAKKKDLEELIVKGQWGRWGLAQYIPIKVSKNLIDGSPEKTFIERTYRDKVKFDAIIKKFESVIASQQYGGRTKNIECTGISINATWDLSTQCMVYGGSIGADGENGKLGSSRIEALKLIDAIGSVETSGFILKNPPSALSAEVLDADTTNPKYADFATRTSLSFDLKNVNFTSDNF